MTEVPLSNLKRWYEENIHSTSTLEIVRYMFQGNFPASPTSQISALGKNWGEIEDRRAELGDEEFCIYLQCQMAIWKECHKDKPFPLAYCSGDAAGERYLERRERIIHGGYYSSRSEIYRAVFPNECAALREYFRRWLCWDGKEEEEEPNWPEVKASFAPRSHPFYVALSCNYEKAVDRGEAFTRAWVSGKKRLKARGLTKDSSEYDRACIDALILTSQQITPRAREFVLFPEEEPSFPYQVALQLYELRFEIRSPSSSLRIRVGDGNEKIDGLPT